MAHTSIPVRQGVLLPARVSITQTVAELKIGRIRAVRLCDSRQRISFFYRIRQTPVLTWFAGFHRRRWRLKAVQVRQVDVNPQSR
jgi:hypothetical protein